MCRRQWRTCEWDTGRADLAYAFLLPHAVRALCPRANAQSWPTRPIEVIVPFPAGGSVDVIARAVATAIGEKLRQQVVVSNRDGASGTVGFNALASAAPDGYTLGAGPTTPIANAPYLMKGVRYNVDSFDYICHVFENAFTIAVAPESKFKSTRNCSTAPQSQSRQAELRSLRQRHHPAPFGREPGRCAEAQVPAGAVPRRKRAHAGAAQGRYRFRRTGGRDPSRARLPPARGLCRSPPSGAAGLPTVRELGVTTSVPPGRTAFSRPRGCRPGSRTDLGTRLRGGGEGRRLCCAPWRIPGRLCIT